MNWKVLLQSTGIDPATNAISNPHLNNVPPALTDAACRLREAVPPHSRAAGLPIHRADATGGSPEADNEALFHAHRVNTITC